MELFAQFIQERVYLKGISPKTVISYQCAFKAFAGATETKTAMMQRAAELRGKGISPISLLPAAHQGVPSIGWQRKARRLYRMSFWYRSQSPKRSIQPSVG